MNLDHDEKRLLTWLVSILPSGEEAHFFQLKRGWVFTHKGSEIDTELISINKMESLADCGLLSFTDTTKKEFYRLRITKDGYDAVKRKFRRKTDISVVAALFGAAAFVAAVLAFLFERYLDR